MPEDQKINYIELPGDDLEALEEFYSGTFGWKFTSYGPEYLAFTDDVLDGGFGKSTAQSRTENGSALVILYARDLEATCKKVIRNKGVICREIFSFPGGRRFHFHDPHGNELAVWSDN